MRSSYILGILFAKHHYGDKIKEDEKCGLQSRLGDDKCT
jgi:hypothetical protein